MASFTDRIPTFNPYVAQQPVEAMVKVGMMKQQQYDTNLQKIQQSMSNIAGLEIARDVDKNYIDGKMKDMSKKLNVYASSDLSSNNLTSSLKGMVNSVADDEIVRTAVSSTQRYKEQLAFIDKEKQAGTLTPDNYYNFQKQASGWFNAPEEGAAFNGQYVKHFDVLEYTKEVFNEIKPDGFEYDDLFSGVDKNGNPMLSPAIKRMKKEGIMPKKAAQVVNQIFSDPRVKQQLQISGEYNYRGASPDMLVQSIERQKLSELDMIKSQVEDLNIKKALGEDVQADLDKLNGQKQELITTYEDYMTATLENPDMARGRLYMDEQRGRYVNMFSNVKESTSYHDNPVWRGNFDVQKEANIQARHRDDQIYKYADLNFRKEKDARDYMQRERKMETDVAKNKKNNTVSRDPFRAQEPSSWSFENYAKTDLQKKSDAFIQNSNDLIWKGLFKDNSEYYGAMQNLVREEGIPQQEAIERIIFDIASKDPEFATEDENGVLGVNMDAFRAKYTQKVISQIYNPATGKPDSSNPLIRQFYNHENSKQDFLHAKSVKDEIDSAFDEDMSKIDKDGIFSSTEAVTLNASDIPEGLQGKTVSPRDILDLEMFNIYGQGLNFSDSAKKKAEYAKKSKERLIAKFGEEGFKRLHVAGTSGFNQLREARVKMRNAVEDFDFTKALEKQDRILKQVYGKKPNLVVGIGTGDNEVDRAALLEIMALAESGEGIYGNPLNDNPMFEQFVKDVNKDGVDLLDLSIKANIINDDSGKAYVVLKAGTANDESQMTVSLAQAEKIGIDVGSMYESDIVTTMRQRLNRNLTTSFGNPQSLETYLNGDSAFKDDFFPHMVGERARNYQVQANIELDNGVYVPHIFFRKFDDEGNPVMQKLITASGSTSLAEVMERLRQRVNPGWLSLQE